MDKKELINNLFITINNNEKIKEVILGISNDHCLNEGTDDIKIRNDLFAFLSVALALLSYSEIIVLNKDKDYCNPSDDEKTLGTIAKKISKNKNLWKLTTDIVNHESEENDSKVRLHIFLNTALAILANRNMITINKNSNNLSPY